MAMYENDMFLLSETSNAFIGIFCYSKIHLHPSGPFKSIKIMLKSLHVLLQYGIAIQRVITRKGLPSIQ